MAERFEAVTRAAGVGHWVNHVGQNRLEWSAECREMHGMGAHEPVPSARQWLEQWVHPDDRARVLEAMARLPAPGMAGVDTALRIVRRDGEVRQLSSHTRVEDEGDGPVIFGVLIDVTERLRFETALRGAQERITLALQGAGIGTWEMDLESRRTVWDEQMWRLRGREPQAVSPSIDELWQWTHPEDHDASRELYRRAEAASAALDNDFRIVTPDGQVRWLASRSSEVRDADGRRRRIGVNWDVTAARTAEVARRDSELARREIQAKSQFLARMSHELRTPLNAVLGFAQLMLADEAGTDGAAASRRRRLHHVQAAGKHLLELINDVLTLSGVDSGELPLVAQPVALSELLSQVLPMLQPLQAGHDVILTQAVPEGLHVSGDATRLRQVLLNLLGNAIKYNRPGGRVHVAVQADGERVRLSISDTGRGMDPLQLSHLFEPFNRLGAERSEVEGTGIGLAIVKALVERMKGSVRAESTPGVGSVFTVDLPWAAAQAANTKADADPGPQAAAGQRNGPRHTLLYVEDNPVNALIIAELVARRRDLVLHIATDGLSGVTQARTLRPELVLLDMQLPDIDGFEVLRRLRADSATAAIPVIALSANAMPEDIDRALAAGCADYWTKPLDFRAFMAGLDSLFGKSPR
jgi:PAS domain S-box-containing protein